MKDVEKKKYIRFFLIFFQLFLIFPGRRAFSDDWVKKGKSWYYMTAGDEPAIENAWLYLDGQEYYIGAKGKMQTGWFKDEDLQEEYYLGDDGAKKYSCYSKDYSGYVGKYGVRYTKFDTWRKKALLALGNDLKEYEKEIFRLQRSGLQVSTIGSPSFSISDVNSDGFRDIIVVNRQQGHDRVLDIRLYSIEDQDFIPVTESDLTEERYSFLRKNTEHNESYVIMSNGQNDFSIFRLSGLSFEYVDRFYEEYNVWGDTVYYRTGEELSAGEWEYELQNELKETGGQYPVIYTPLTKNNYIDEINQPLTDEEDDLWHYMET